jgi:hypothetical protein
MPSWPWARQDQLVLYVPFDIEPKLQCDLDHFRFIVDIDNCPTCRSCVVFRLHGIGRALLAYHPTVALGPLRDCGRLGLVGSGSRGCDAHDLATAPAPTRARGRVEAGVACRNPSDRVASHDADGGGSMSPLARPGVQGSRSRMAGEVWVFTYADGGPLLRTGARGCSAHSWNRGSCRPSDSTICALAPPPLRWPPVES